MSDINERIKKYLKTAILVYSIVVALMGIPVFLISLFADSETAYRALIVYLTGFNIMIGLTKGILDKVIVYG